MTRKGSWVQVPHGPPVKAQVRTVNPERGGSPKAPKWPDGHILVTRICYRGPGRGDRGAFVQGRVYRRGTGWAFKVDLPRDPATGQRRQRQKGGFATRKAAEEGLTDLLGEIRTDVVAGTGTIKLEGLAQ